MEENHPEITQQCNNRKVIKDNKTNLLINHNGSRGIAPLK